MQLGLTRLGPSFCTGYGNNMISRFQSKQLDGRRHRKITRKRDSLRRFLRCESLEDRRLLAGIFGYKFEDLNRNGIDDNERRVPGVQISVTYASGSNQVTQSVTTGADGTYQFLNLPAGTMTVTEVPPPGLDETSPNPAPFLLSATENAVAVIGQSGSVDNETVIPQLAFGNAVARGSIYGYKFEDSNGNGVDDGEPRLAGVPIELEYSFDGGNFRISTTTDATGEYQFEDLPSTTMTVTEVPPTGSVQTTPLTTSFLLNVGENAVAVAGQSGVNNETVINELAFGNAFLGSIHGFKFEDINGNGIYEPNLGEVPQADVQFTLTGIDGRGQSISTTMLTDASGAFWFENLWPSVDGSTTGETGVTATGYTVAETLPNGFTALTTASRTFDLMSRQELVWESGQANLPPGDPRVEVVVGNELVYANVVLGSIHGFKFADVNGNGIYEPGSGESGAAGVTFTLTGIDGLGQSVNLTTTTGIDGEFEFVGLPPSNGTGYLVSEVLPTGFVATTPSSRSFDLMSRQEYVWQLGAADLGPGDPRVEVLATMDPSSNLGEELIFGNVIPGSIHGFKFLDVDGDGMFDPDTEAGLADIPFQLTGVDSSVRQRLT